MRPVNLRHTMKLQCTVTPTLALCAILVFFTGCGRKPSKSAAVADIAPADTTVFLHIADLPRTQERWKGTALAAIAGEPEVKAFLGESKPLSSTPAGPYLEKLNAANIKEAFFALQSIEKDAVKALAGVRIAGDKKALDALVAEIAGAAKKQEPTGKADVTKHGATTIESFSTDKWTIAVADAGDWKLFATGLDIMKSALDAVAAGKSEKPLSVEAAFKGALEGLPNEPDTFVYIAAKPLFAKLKAFMLATGQPVDETAWKETDKIESAALSTKIEGKVFRDTMRVFTPGTARKVKLSGALDALTGPDTLAYFASKSVRTDQSLETMFKGNPQLAPFGEIVAGFLEPHGVTLANALDLFDLESGLAFDWNPVAMMPSLTIALGLTDAPKVSAIVGDLFARFGAGIGMEAVSEGSFRGYKATGVGGPMLPIEPTIGVAGSHLLITLDAATAKSAAARLASPGTKVTNSETWKTGMKTVGAAESAVGYLDLKRIFEQLYGTLRPMAMMMGGFGEKKGGRPDFSKMPTTETIAKHLSPSVMAQRADGNSVILESVGPVTVPGIVLTVSGAAGCVAAAQNAGLLPKIPGLPGASGGAGPGTFNAPAPFDPPQDDAPAEAE